MPITNPVKGRPKAVAKAATIPITSEEEEGFIQSFEGAILVNYRKGEGCTSI